MFHVNVPVTVTSPQSVEWPFTIKFVYVPPGITDVAVKLSACILKLRHELIATFPLFSNFNVPLNPSKLQFNVPPLTIIVPEPVILGLAVEVMFAISIVPFTVKVVLFPLILSVPPIDNELPAGIITVPAEKVKLLHSASAMLIVSVRFLLLTVMLSVAVGVIVALFLQALL